MLADPFNDVFANICEKQSKKMLDLEVKLNLNEEQWGKLVWEEVSVVKFDLKKGFIQHTESLLSSWSELHADSSVSLSHVSTMLESQLSLF